MRALVLPGLDGGGALLDDFLAAMRPRLDGQALAYPGDPALGYAELIDWAWPQLPTDAPFALIGESFSGPVAIGLAARRPPQLKALVLCASFVRAPRPPWSPLGLAALPAWTQRLPLQRAPLAAVARATLGRWSTAPRRQRLRAALDALDPAVLRRRLGEIARVDARAALAEVAVPTLYLRAGADRLVSRDSWEEIRRARPQTDCIALDAPHFVLQACADEAAARIGRWLDRGSGVGSDVLRSDAS
ncbi:Serine aminopeptidase, S33 [Lysobacter sp. yr284]|uniref:alpha/beta fold hydrolase n=1 Tax=Lysobacter TaxID=68 RepID=UPI000898CC1D|nr:alpha/beta hydrolase [Lysobacter sp. yr284]SDY72072.1 Serine aminopeptidase, S33 [Lysobacter sp. yr284]